MSTPEHGHDTGTEGSGRDGLNDVVAGLLGRRPQGAYEVVVSRPDGAPVVLANHPLLDDGRPMPTRFWLIDPDLNKAIGRLESVGGVKDAERAIDPHRLKQAHDGYAHLRSELIPDDHSGPRPSGGVGGTRQGVKCLHAHYAYYLAGGDDPVGQWVHAKLTEVGAEFRTNERDFRRAADDQPWFVEIGSGSLKWAIPGERDDLARSSRYLGLATQMSEVGTLSDEALSDLDAALADLASIKAEQGLPSPVVVASEIARRTERGQAVIGDLVERHLGSELIVLSAEQEGALALRGAMSGRSVADAGRPIAVVDIGSASTELVTDGGEGSTADSFSMPLGGHTVAQTYLETDPPDPRELSAALSVIELHLDDLRRQHHDLARALNDGTVVAMGAAVQIAAVEIGVDISSTSAPVNGYVLDQDAAEEIFRVLATESRHDRAHNPGLLPQHIDGVVGALCIVVELLRQFSIERLEITTANLLDGLIVSHQAGGAKLSL